ncbi:MAG TPA: SRPBCC family protein [Acidimicrobiales bacterium]
MAPTQEIDVRVHTTADPATVHALLLDGSTWPTWSPLSSFELEAPAPDGTEGVGALRIFRTRRGPLTITSRERVVEVVPDRRFSYAALSGLPVRDYRADVDVEPDPAGGSTIRWHSTFRGAFPGAGWWVRRTLAPFIRRSVEGLAAHAAALATTR